MSSVGGLLSGMVFCVEGLQAECRRDGGVPLTQVTGWIAALVEAGAQQKPIMDITTTHLLSAQVLSHPSPSDVIDMADLLGRVEAQTGKDVQTQLDATAPARVRPGYVLVSTLSQVHAALVDLRRQQARLNDALNRLSERCQEQGFVGL